MACKVPQNVVNYCK